jgi:ankyrin repeat protein
MIHSSVVARCRDDPFFDIPFSLNLKRSRGLQFPLFSAVESGNHQTVQLLISAGANANFYDSERGSILQFAMECELRPEMINLLSTAGARSDA